MDKSVLSERRIILQLAVQEAMKKRDECQSDLDKLGEEFSVLNADGASFEEKDKLLDSMVYMKSCVDGWKKTIEAVWEWEREINS